jgi:hypothetical protein
MTVSYRDPGKERLRLAGSHSAEISAAMTTISFLALQDVTWINLDLWRRLHTPEAWT